MKIIDYTEKKKCFIPTHILQEGEWVENNPNREDYLLMPNCDIKSITILGDGIAAVRNYSHFENKRDHYIYKGDFSL